MKVPCIPPLVAGLLALPLPVPAELAVEVSAILREHVPVPAPWQYPCGSFDSPAGWIAPGFDASAWCTGLTPFGFGEEDGEINTAVVDMADVRITLPIRTEFDVGGAIGEEPLELEVDYDDGFIVYVNGREVARRGLPAGPVDPGTSAENHESGMVEAVPLGPASAVLSEGPNVLAVEVHNSSLLNHDLLIAAALVSIDGVRRDGDAWTSSVPLVRLGGTIPRPTGGVQAVRIDGRPARYDGGTGDWIGRAELVPGRNQVLVEALGAGSVALDTASMEIAYLPPGAVPFIRGDGNADGGADLSDAVAVLLGLFEGGAGLPCEAAADLDDDGKIDLSDPIRLLGFLFLAGPPPAAPFPGCGPDPSPGPPGCDRPPPCPEGSR